VSAAVVTIANTAGGSGKSTVAHALSVAMVEYGKKTLLIDLDPRASLTFRVGRDGHRLTAADFLSGTTLKVDDLDPTSERFDFIPADARIGYGFDEGTLKVMIENLPKDFDLVIIDTASDVNQALVAALAVADLIVVPLSHTVHGFKGAQMILSLKPDSLIRLLQVGEETSLTTQIKESAHLDLSISRSDELEAAEFTTTSILTTSQQSEISAQFRDCAYSVLELLEMD
jgi:cellulose biosynthesis protein BcsQ